MEYKAELDEVIKRRNKYEENIYKSYAELWERCAVSLKAKIEARVEYESKIYNDPIELLKAIKEYELSYEDTRYDMRIILDAFRAYFGCKQKEKESLLEYIKRFKLARDILKSHIGGENFLRKIIEADSSYASADPADQIKIIKEADERFSTYIYLDNSDKAKYGSVMSGLNSQKSLKNDQFPNTLIDRHNALSNNPWGNSKNLKNKNNNNNNEKDKEQETPLTFTQNKKDIICFFCGKKGHNSKECTKKDIINKENWWCMQPENKTFMEKFNKQTNGKKVQFASTEEEIPQVANQNVHHINNNNDP